METVTLALPRRRSIRGGDAFELFSDHATGVIDAQNSLNDRPIPFWGGLPPAGGHLIGGHLIGLHLDHVIPDGHLSGRHLAAEHLWPAAELSFETLPLYFGTFQFAAVTVDCFGNQGAVMSNVARRFVNSSPRRASNLKRGVFDEIGRRMSFTFTPSPDL